VVLSRSTTIVIIPALLFIGSFTFLYSAKGFKNSMIKILPYIILTFIYLFLIKSDILTRITFADGAVYGDSSLLQRFIILSKVFLFYLKLIFIPTKLGLFHSIGGEGIRNINIASIFSVILILSMVYIIFRYGRTHKVLSFALAWFIITFLPYSNIFVPAASAVAERYLYLSCIGIYVLIALVLLGLTKKLESKLWKKTGVITISLFVFIFGFYSFLTVRRNMDYKTAISFFSSNVENFPDNAKAHNELGIAYFINGDTDKAMYYYKKAAILDSEYYPIFNNLCSACIQKGEFDTAEEYCNRALDLNPDNINAYINLASISNSRLNFDAAINYVQKAINIDPYNAQAYNTLGVSYGNAGNYEEAARNFKKAIELNPSLGDARRNFNIADSLRRAT